MDEIRIDGTPAPCPTPSLATLSLAAATADGGGCEQLIDLRGEVSSDIHRQLYGGQKLDTTINLIPPLLAVGVDIVVEYFLTQNFDPTVQPTTQERIATKTVVLSPEPYSTELVIPKKQQIFKKESLDTWFLKVKIDATNVLDEGENGEQNNLLLSVPLHTTGDKKNGLKTSTATTRYEDAVQKAKTEEGKDYTLADAVKDIDPNGTKVGCSSAGTAINYAACNEGFIPQIYLDTVGVPTIAFGYALFGSERSTAIQRIEDAQLVLAVDPTSLNLFQQSILVELNIQPGIPITGQQFWELRNKLLTPGLESNFVTVAGNPALGLPFVSIGGPKTFEDFGREWLADDLEEKEQELETLLRQKLGESGKNAILNRPDSRVKTVLLDIVYNIGPVKFKRFKNFWWALKQYTTTNDERFRAAAAYHLLDSTYADQVGDRAARNFRLFVHGAEEHL